MRVLVADGREKVRSALQLLLEQEEDVDVVGEASSDGSLLAVAEEQGPDVILVDWELPGRPMGTLLPTLRLLLPAVKVIALSGRPEARLEATEAGVEAFVSKNAPSEELLAALDELRAATFGPEQLAGGEQTEGSPHVP